VIRVGRVDVDRLLDESKPPDVGEELDVLLRVARDHRDVVHALELHGLLQVVAHATISDHCARNHR